MQPNEAMNVEVHSNRMNEAMYRLFNPEFCHCIECCIEQSTEQSNRADLPSSNETSVPSLCTIQSTIHSMVLVHSTGGWNGGVSMMASEVVDGYEVDDGFKVCDGIESEIGPCIFEEVMLTAV